MSQTENAISPEEIQAGRAKARSDFQQWKNEQAERQAEQLQAVSFEEAQAVLRQHGLRVTENDVEVVMLVALWSAFFQREQELLEKHNAALTGVLGKNVTQFGESLTKAQADFAHAVRSVALENVTALISQHQKDMTELAASLRVHGWLTSGLTLFALLASFIGLGVLAWL